MSSVRTYGVLNIQVAATDYDSAADWIIAWAKHSENRTVCAANVHVAMEAFDHPEFREAVNSCDLVTPDGMPLVWVLRRLGENLRDRVYGPSLTLHICDRAAGQGVPIGFFGSKPETLDYLCGSLQRRFPSLKITYRYAPPFRPLSPEEMETIIAGILDSGCRILFVGLGCPKQEMWMAEYKNRLPLVQVGVGAAFDFHAGTVRQAPLWLQRRGLEWAFRFAMEPKRLWKRYLYHNPRFLYHVGLQVAGIKKY